MGKRLSCYCAFCRTPREVYRRKTLSPRHLLGAACLAVPVGFMIWGELDPRMLFLVGIFSIVIEFGLLLRRRAEMACPHCGFDPVIYKQNPDRACTMVIAHLKTRGEDPRAWMGHRPPLKLPVRRVDNSATAKPKTSGKTRALDLTL